MSELPELTEFSERVYWLVAQIPSGRVASYGQIAHLAGAPRAARAVGTLMRRAFENGHGALPWQRVINSKGAVSFKGDVERANRQRTLLEDEGIAFSKSGVCELELYEWSPDSAMWGVDW